MTEVREQNDHHSPIAARNLYEIRAEPDEGFTLPLDGRPSEPWVGVRLRYRKLGSRGRFASFLLTMDDSRVPTIAEMQEACALHAAR